MLLLNPHDDYLPWSRRSGIAWSMSAETRHKYFADRRARIAKMHEQGESLVTIGRAFGISGERVKQIIAKERMAKSRVR